MQEEEDVLDRINHVKALADQLACMEVPVRDEGGKLVCERRAESGELNLRHELRGKMHL